MLQYVPRHRAVSWGKPVGPWRETEEKAIADALDARIATWCEIYDRFFFDTNCGIERKMVAELASAEAA